MMLSFFLMKNFTSLLSKRASRHTQPYKPRTEHETFCYSLPLTTCSWISPKNCSLSKNWNKLRNIRATPSCFELGMRKGGRSTCWFRRRRKKIKVRSTCLLRTPPPRADRYSNLRVEIKAFLFSAPDVRERKRRSRRRRKRKRRRPRSVASHVV